MTSEEEKFCVEKPEEKKEEHESKRVMIFLAVLLG